MHERKICMTAEWIEEQIARELEGGNAAQCIRDYALLCIARDHLRMECKHQGRHPAMTPERARAWVEAMKPKARWTRAEVKPFAEAIGMGDRLTEMYAIMNAMASDYGDAAAKYKVDTPEFYADLAKAWLCDEDAVPDKAAAYYGCVVKHEDDEEA